MKEEEEEKEGNESMKKREKNKEKEKKKRRSNRYQGLLACRFLRRTPPVGQVKAPRKKAQHYTIGRTRKRTKRQPLPVSVQLRTGGDTSLSSTLIHFT
jgi:hypothetical protein